MALAPLAVEPSFHGTGIGGALIREAHVRLKQAGEKLSIVVGEPAYYGRFGYAHERASKFESDYQCEALQALAWGEAPESGRLVYAAAFGSELAGLSRCRATASTSNMTARPMPAGSGRPASIRCRRRSSRRSWGSAARRSSLRGAGRTDAGVHAAGQVAHVDLDKDWPADTVRDAVNAHLQLAGEAVSIIAAARRLPRFDARFSATAGTISIASSTAAPPPALEKDRAWWVPKPLDAEAMHDAAQALVGRHDFTTFRSIQCQAKSPLRTLDRLDVTRVGDIIEVRASARSFLHNQVRSMVGSLKRVGEGAWTPPTSRRRSRRRTAPPAGRWRRPTGSIWSRWTTRLEPEPAARRGRAPTASNEQHERAKPANMPAKTADRERSALADRDIGQPPGQHHRQQRRATARAATDSSGGGRAK